MRLNILKQYKSVQENQEEAKMNVNQDLVGKTITGVIASAEKAGSAREIWLLQFSDGSHVEFVSPGARKGLRSSGRRSVTRKNQVVPGSLQLALNVA